MVATAIGLVVLYGTLMIPVRPLLTGALGLEEQAAGLWIGAATPEVAQVVAAGVLVRATGWLPAGVLDAAALVQQLLLATAMAALGLGVHLRSIAAVGPRPLVLGAASTAVAVAVGGLGAALLA